MDAALAFPLDRVLDRERARSLSAPTRASLVYIARHYGERIRLADVAGASAQTPFQLIRAFRREIGTTPHAFIVRVRVTVATTLLVAGEPIAAIATAVGFVDQAHFTRHFKRLHGRTPARHQAAIGLPSRSRRPFALSRAGATGGRYGAAAC